MSTTTTFRFCLTGIFFPKVMPAPCRSSKEVSLGIYSTRFLYGQYAFRAAPRLVAACDCDLVRVKARTWVHLSV